MNPSLKHWLIPLLIVVLLTGCSTAKNKDMIELEKRVLRLEIFEVDRQTSNLKTEVEEYGCGLVDFFWQMNAEEYKRIKDRSAEINVNMDEQVDSQVRGHLEMLNGLDCEEEFWFGENNQWLSREEPLTDEMKALFEEMDQDFADTQY